MKTLIRIGIDPGSKTGIAAYLVQTKKLILCETDSIVGAMKTVEDLLSVEDNQLELWFEDARKRKWFGDSGREKLQGAGSVKRDSKIWQEFCEFHQIPYSAIPPRQIKTKMNTTVFKRITGWEGRTSEHARDAGSMVFGS